MKKLRTGDTANRRGGSWHPGVPLIDAAGWVTECVRTVATGYPHLMQLHLPLPGGPESAGMARAAVRKTIADWNLAEPLDDAVLIVSELVTNAFRYGAGPLVLHLTVKDGYLVLGVQDNEPASTPSPKDVPDTQPDGRGLKLISAIASQWGWDHANGQKIVWAQIPIRH